MKRLLLLLNGCSCILEERGNGEYEVFSAKEANHNNKDLINPIPFMRKDSIANLDIPNEIEQSNSIDIVIQYVLNDFTDDIYSYPKLFLSKKVEDYLIEQGVLKITSNDFTFDVDIDHTPIIKFDGVFDSMTIVGEHDFIFENWTDKFDIDTLNLKKSLQAFDCSMIKRHMKIEWLCLSSVRLVSNTENLIKNKHIQSFTISSLRAELPKIAIIVKKHLDKHDVNAFIEEMIENGFEEHI